MRGCETGARPAPALPALLPLTRTCRQTEELCAGAALSPPVRLVVVDSLTFPFRDLDVSAPGQAAHRSELLYTLASRLKALAQAWRVAVVVTNHVVDCVEQGSSSLLALERRVARRVPRAQITM